MGRIIPYIMIYVYYIFSPLRCLGCIPLRVFLRLDMPLLRHCYAAEVPLIARATAAAVALYSQPLTESMRCTWENSGKIPGYAWRFENGDSMGIIGISSINSGDDMGIYPPVIKLSRWTCLINEGFNRKIN